MQKNKIYRVGTGRNQCDSDEICVKGAKRPNQWDDDTTGLYYYGARYYAPWLGRWMSCDPAGPQDGLNLYCFTRDNPIILIDPQGTKSKHKQETLEEKLDQVNKAIDEMQSYKMLLSWRNFSLSKADPEDKAISP